MKQWIKKTLLFGCTLAMIGGMLMLVAVNAAKEEATLTLPQGFVATGESFAAGRWEEATLTLGSCSGVLLCGRLEEQELIERYCGGGF